MAITVKTTDPSGLLAGIKKEIKEGKIDTWNYEVHDSSDFTHNPKQWFRQAWLKPSVGTNELVFSIAWSKGKAEDRATSGVYHGRFIEMLCNHFAAKFSSISATLP